MLPAIGGRVIMGMASTSTMHLTVRRALPAPTTGARYRLAHRRATRTCQGQNLAVSLRFQPSVESLCGRAADGLTSSVISRLPSTVGFCIGLVTSIYKSDLRYSRSTVSTGTLPPHPGARFIPPSPDERCRDSMASPWQQLILERK